LMQVSDAPALYGQLLKSLTVDGSGNNVVTYAVLDQLFKQLSDDQTANPLFTYQAVTHFLNDHVTVQLSARPTTALTDVVLFPFAPVLGLTINGMANISPVIDAAYETAIGAYFQKMAAQFLSQTEKDPDKKGLTKALAVADGETAAAFVFRKYFQMAARATV